MRTNVAKTTVPTAPQKLNKCILIKYFQVRLEEEPTQVEPFDNPFSVIMLTVIMLSAIMLSVIMLSVIMPNVILLSVILLSVIMMSVICWDVVVPLWALTLARTY
jgi:hypothetical protein